MHEVCWLRARSGESECHLAACKREIKRKRKKRKRRWKGMAMAMQDGAEGREGEEGRRGPACRGPRWVRTTGGGGWRSSRPGTHVHHARRRPPAVHRATPHPPAQRSGPCRGCSGFAPFTSLHLCACLRLITDCLCAVARPTRFLLCPAPAPVPAPPNTLSAPALRPCHAAPQFAHPCLLRYRVLPIAGTAVPRAPRLASIPSRRRRGAPVRPTAEIIGAKDLEQQSDARWLASVYFKNSINRYWRTRRDSPGISDAEKPHLRNRLLDLIREENDQVAVQLALLISKIARFDYPREWPELFPTLLQKLQSPDVLTTQRVYLVLNQTLKELSTKRLAADQRNFAEYFLYQQGDPLGEEWTTVQFTMSWFSSTFSLSSAPSPENKDFGERDEDGDSPRLPAPLGKGVTDEFSELTKNLTRQLWGVASFLAPPITEEGSPKHTSAPQTETNSYLGDPTSAAVIATDDKDITGSPLVVGVAGVEVSSLVESQKTSGDLGNSSASGSPSAHGDKLTGFRSDLAELRGTMATGFSRIQTVIRAVTQDEDEDMDDDAGDEASLVGGSVSGLPQTIGDETSKNSGLSSLLKPLLVSMSSFRERIPQSQRGLVGEHGEGDEDHEIRRKPTGQSSLAGSIGGLSRLATSFIPYARDIVGEISRRDYYAVALTDEVVAFADNIAMHPETWLDFPSLQDEDENDFEMTEVQREHVRAVVDLSSRLAAVHRELCPAFVGDGRFWKIYFVLLHSRLSKEDAELLSTSQILRTRELLLRVQKEEEPRTVDTAPTWSEREELELTNSNMMHLPYEHVALEEQLQSTAVSVPLPIMEEVSLDDASHSKSESSQEIVAAATDFEEEAHDSSPVHFAALKLDEEADVDAWLDEGEQNDVEEIAEREAAVNMDEDVSFSDLEDDEECSKEEDESHAVINDLRSGDHGTSDQASHGDVPCGSKTEHDWHTVNKEDVTSPTSSSP